VEFAFTCTWRATLAAAVLRDAWEAQAEHWVRWARAPGHDSYWRFHRDAFLTIVPAPGRLTLDVGCGEGRLSRDLAALGHRVIGLDPSPTLARYAAAEGGTLGTVLADGAHLPLATGAAHLVVAFMSLQDMDDMEGCVREVARVLEPGGRLCLAVVNPINSAHTLEPDNSPGRDGPWVIEPGVYWTRRRVSDEVERDGMRMTFNSLHRPLEGYFAALEATGLLTEAVREPQGPAPSSSSLFPWFLHIRARRPE
jgi:SAM-dependent methyltransferase